MSNLKANTSIRATQRILWWCSGANISLLSECKSDWQKFYTIGLSVISSGFIAALSFIVVGDILFKNIYLTLILGIISGAIIFNLNRFIASTFPTQKKAIKNLVFILPRILLAVNISLTISFPLQLILFKDTIELKLQTGNLGLTHNFLDKVTAFNELRSDNTSITIISWLLNLLFLALEIMPILVIWLSPKGAYEKLLEFNEDFERQQVEVNKKLEQEKLELSEYYGRKQNELFEIEKLEILKNNLEKRIRRREALTVIPFGGFEFYIDYKTLPLNDMNSLFATLNNIYSAVYQIESFNKNTILSKQPFYNINEILKSHPEDVLSIHSIETGNSVTFKISTGWKPNVELIKGDFIITLPKGSLALLITGYLITNIFDYGISNYKQILEVQKLEKENKILENQLFKEQLSLFNSKLKDSSDEVKEKFQFELFKFYELTLANSNFIETKITQDTLIMEKMEQGKLIIESGEK